MTHSVKMDGMLFCFKSVSIIEADIRKTELTGLPVDPPGMDISMILLGGRTYTDPGGINACGVIAPLMICCNTGTVGGMNFALLTLKSRVAKENWTSRLILTSAAPRLPTPGAAGFARGTMLVSDSDIATIETVVGSATVAPEYLRIAEFVPPAKP